MKIAFVLSTCEKKGPFIVANDIARNLSREVSSIDIFYLRESSAKLPFEGTSHKKSLLSKTNFSEYDVVHSHGFLGDVYAFLNKGSIQGKWISTLHQKIEPVYSMAYSRLIGVVLEFIWFYMVSHASSVVCLTLEMATYYKKKKLLRKANITFIYNGTTPVLNGMFSLPNNEALAVEKLKKFTVLGVSANVIYLKGIDRVIESMALPKGSHLSLLVLGEGPEKRRLIRLAENLRVDERVLFLGFKDNAIDYFKYFDLYMMSSRSEGFGLCVIEAASQKIPVVCNDIPVYRELFTDDAIVRFSLNDSCSLISAVETALTNKITLSENIHSIYKNKFSAKAMASNYLKLYKENKQQSLR